MAPSLPDRRRRSLDSRTQRPAEAAPREAPPAPQTLNALTFDVEDWYHGFDLRAPGSLRLEPRLSVGLTRVLDILDAHRVKATFFILGALVEAWQPLLGLVADAGHEIATHGFHHTPVYRLTPEGFTRDLRQALAALRAITDRPVLSYRAPFFSITAESLWALPILAEAGIAHDSSIVPAHNPRYGIPQAERFPHHVSVKHAGKHAAAPGITTDLLEYPISTISIGGAALPFSGGFYARFLPYHLIGRATRQINALGQPVIFYFHPWEFDIEQPRVDNSVPWLYRFTHYYRLASTPCKLEALLKSFRFGPLSELASSS
jgi:polysaccharide deacetylase family protein (PEP-CTERM system associated)